jgi:5-oxoprolinase (ATP-hydrolysing)
MTAKGRKGWRVWVDRGGTFTDIVAVAPDGRISTRKLLSENPARYDDAVLAGIRESLGIDPAAPIPKGLLESVKIGTTVATNALLERRGEPTLLAVTRGFADQLRIADQNRPEIFARRIVLPEPLYAEVVEIDERVSASGEVIVPLDKEAAFRAFAAAAARGLRAVAIVLLHAYRFPAHEERLMHLAREAGFTHVSASHRVSPFIKFVPRGQTTVVDSYLSPALSRYVAGVAAVVPGARLLFMQSNGGLAESGLFHGKDAVLSGPAGGINGAVAMSRAAGFDRVITFDMGGTSTDVALYDGAFERSHDNLVAGVRIQAPMLKIHTVAAGGGSKLHFDGARYRVGPDSAGADPGPACYGRDGPLTVTDCNVMAGKVDARFFPHIFGPRQDQPIDVAIVQRKFAALADGIGEATGARPDPRAAAEGFIRVAVDNMANAIKKISVQRGRDATDYTLCCFGGAGGQHACLVAEALSIPRVLVPPMAGVLSALGIGLAAITALVETGVERPLDALPPGDIADLFAGPEQDALARLARQGVGPEEARVTRTLHLRYEGTDSALPVPFAEGADLRAAFEAEHCRLHGFVSPERRVIVAAAVAEASGGAAALPPNPLPESREPPSALAVAALFSGGREHAAPIFDRRTLKAGAAIAGPAVIVEPDATTVVEPGWRAEVLAPGHLLLSRTAPARKREIAGAKPDPVLLEVFNNLFMSVAEQMGATLANTAQSVNIRERLDFSCAVFDRNGDLVANAPHVPVHLGSMSESVKAVIDSRGPRMKPGESYALNAPYRGGTHLPDISVVTPVFDEAGKDLLFFVASRGHHADIGGVTPGSMPPASRSVDEEGILLEDFELVAGGRFREAELTALLTAPPWPARNPAQNIADLKAQVAANETGARELRRAVGQHGLPVVRAYMAHVQDNAEASVRRTLDRLRDGAFETRMDDGAVIRVRVTIDRRSRSATIDFTGTSAQRPNNFNAPFAVTRAVALYVFRTLVDEDIPLNSGCLRPLHLVVPEGSMLHPRYPAAVVAGNVETSQWAADALFAALGQMAACQGTMNNFTFGTGRYQYYETICGGSGAGPGFDGATAVHTHMTNSRLTDPEVLEARFPVMVEEFRIRRGSGGAGRWRGGDGVVRRVRFLEPMTAAILSTRRLVAPFGLEGGGDGMPGANVLIRANGETEELPGTVELHVNADDAIVIETPGGGGFGAYKKKRPSARFRRQQ